MAGYELALAPPMPPSPRSRRPPSSWSTSTIFIDVVSPIIINNNITNRSNNSNSPARGGRRVRGILSLLVVTRLSWYLGGWEIGADVDPQTMKTTSEGNVDRVILVSSRGIVKGADSSWSGRRLGEGRGDTSSSAAVVGARSHPTCGDIIPRCTAPMAVATGRWRRGDCRRWRNNSMRGDSRPDGGTTATA